MPATLRRLIIVGLILLVDVAVSLAKDGEFDAVSCEGMYSHHLQGVCTDRRDTIYWSFTTTLVKTDTQGHVLSKVPVANHHGDLCFLKGKLYVAVNLGKFNDPAGNADSWVYVYDARDLSLLSKHATPQVFHGAGGIGFCEGSFFVVGGLPPTVARNLIYEYDSEFRFVKEHHLESGNTLMGIQTATFAKGHWWFGCYGNPRVLLKADKSLNFLGKYEFDASLGIVELGAERFLVARGACEANRGCQGRLVVAGVDPQQGLVLETAK